MPIKINNQYIVPAPLVSFDKNYIHSADGETIGAEYTISLAGKILPNKGNPVVDSATFESSFSSASWAGTKSPDDDPSHGIADVDDDLLSIMSKQEALRQVFSIGQAVQVEILDLNLRSGGRGIKFVGNVQSIQFSDEGRWVLPCSYTVSLTTNNFLESVDGGDFTAHHSEDEFRYFIKEASETWDIEESEQKYYRGDNSSTTLKVYEISHSISSVGQAVYSATGVFDAAGDQAQTTQGRYDAPYVNGLAPWQQASGYVYKVLEGGGNNFPGGVFDIDGSTFTFGNALFDNSGTDKYILADRTLTENINIKGGSYSIDERFVVFPSGAFNDGNPIVHTNNVNVSVGEDGLSQISIDGVIRGLNTIAFEATGNMGHTFYPNRHEDNSFKNANDYYNNYVLADVGGSSLSSRVYHLARKASELDWLHPRAKSNSKGLNASEGTISYNFTYDDRPPNIIQGSVSEDISVNDTHPGQIFATIPVIGRNQPVLQYLNSRSEYKRSLSINVQMPKFSPNWIAETGAIITASGYWSAAQGVQSTSITNPDTNDSILWWLHSKKPSVTNAGDFQKIFDAANPANEILANGFTNEVINGRCFHSAPTESWNPRTGQYSYSIEWTFERLY
tara:strand:- start:15504 stop:17363 length:1860 start_codon:yes stop_codon:yes gene_type:complete